MFLGFPTIKQIKKILVKEKIDIVHFMTPVPSGIMAMLAARELGLGVVGHSHTQPENIFLRFPPMFRNKFVYDLCYRYIASVYNKADIIACPSAFAEKKIKEYIPNLILLF